ncbi:MAG: HAD hydrolase family protein, partial [Lachnospiraceae bacterium]|nr:HAD hydrolase family protein [Lachnospiraceae bacterium]
MSKKIFFLDLDDTLLTTDKHISETTYDAISHWCGKGNLIAVNSGRPMRSVIDTLKELKLDVFEESYAIAFDGAWIKD